MSVRRRLGLLACGCLLLLLIVGGGAAAIGVSRPEHDRVEHDRVETTALVNAERALELKAAATDMETGKRGFLLGGTAAFLDPYTNGRDNVERLQAALTAGLGSPALRTAMAQLEAVKRAADAWIDIAALKCKEIIRVAMPPGDALQLLADQVDFESSFVTAFVALVDTRTGLCAYANGGHAAFTPHRFE